MGTSVVCHRCQRKIDLRITHSNLPTNFQTTCTTCGLTDTYFATEAYEERWNYNCVFCNNKFNRKISPPANVTCPHCLSKLSIDYNGYVTLYRQGTRPTSQANDTVAGGILGAILGAAVAGPAGAVLGALFGGVVGASAGNKEAIEGW